MDIRAECENQKKFSKDDRYNRHVLLQVSWGGFICIMSFAGLVYWVREVTGLLAELRLERQR
jgi:hypothetical protein